MDLTQAVQEGLVTLLCFDMANASAVEALVPVGEYDPIFRDVARKAIEYRHEYGDVPGEHTIDLFHECIRLTPDKAELFERRYRSLHGLRDSINPNYMINQATAFRRYQRMKQAMSDVIERLDQATPAALDEAESLLQKALDPINADVLDLGTDFFGDINRSLAFFDKDSETFPTGIKFMDDNGCGPARGELHLLMALSGRGKSWWLVNLAKRAIQFGKRALYVTLEMGEADVAQRLAMSMFSYRKRDKPVPALRFERNKVGEVEQVVRMVIDGRPAFEDPRTRGLLKTKLESWGRRTPIRIKQFPTGELTIAQLEAYLDILERREHFIPDILLIDYPDLMRPEAGHRESYQGIMANYKLLRGMAVRRDFACAAVTQSNRMGVNKELLTEENMSGDIGKYQISDQCVTYNQTLAEKELGLARLHQAKARGEVDKFTVAVTQAYGIGQFCIDSALQTKSVAGMLGGLEEDAEVAAMEDEFDYEERD